MTSPKSTFICLCTDNKKLTKAQFSQLLKGISQLNIKMGPLKNELLKQGIFHYYNVGPHKSGIFNLGLTVYVIPPKEKVNSIFNDLKKEFLSEKKENAKLIGRISKHVYDGYSLSMSIRIDSIGENSFESNDFAQMPSIFYNILSVIASVIKEKVPMKVCSIFLFEREHDKLSGGLALPTKLPLQEKLFSRTGEASIHGLELHFEKSPIGLDEVTFSIDGKILKSKLISISQMPISNETLKEVYDHSLRLTKLFFD